MLSGQLGTAALGTWQLGAYTTTVSGFDQIIVDGITFTDTLKSTPTPKLTDTLTFTDTATGLLLSLPVTDGLTFTDSLLNKTRFIRSVSDTLTLTESISFPIRETLAFTETLTSVHVRVGIVSENLFFTDIAIGVVTSVRDSLVFVDTVTLNRFLNLRVVESLSFNDTGLVVKRGKIAEVSDTLTFTDGLTREIKRVSAADGLAFTDSLSVKTVFNRTIENDAFQHKPIEQLYWYEDILVQNVLHPSVADTFGFKDEAYVYKSGTGMELRGVTSTMVIQSAEFNDFISARSKLMLNRSMSNVIRTYVKTTKRRLLNYRWIIPRPKGIELRNFLILNHGYDIVIHDWEGRRWKTKLKSDSVDFKETGRWDPCGNKVEVTVEFEGTQL